MQLLSVANGSGDKKDGVMSSNLVLFEQTLGEMARLGIALCMRGMQPLLVLGSTRV